MLLAVTPEDAEGRLPPVRAQDHNLTRRHVPEARLDLRLARPGAEDDHVTQGAASGRELRDRALQPQRLLTRRRELSLTQVDDALEEPRGPEAADDLGLQVGWQLGGETPILVVLDVGLGDLEAIHRDHQIALEV